MDKIKLLWNKICYKFEKSLYLIMISLDINIKQIAKPLEKETKGRNFATIKIPTNSKKSLDKELSKKLDVFILAIEGSLKHLDEIDMLKSKKLLKETDIIINDFYSFDDKLSKIHYFQNPKIKEKIKYLLKNLHTFESIVRKNTLKEKPVIKTPKKIADDISKLNRKSISKVLESEL